MIKSGNSIDDKTSDTFIREAIKETLQILKINPPKFQAVFNDGSTVNFDTYEDAMEFFVKNPKCKVFVR